ncbi:mannan polymerase II complex MNN11 subunit [Geosmithia morbida]|uniref:Mannan polymerase II complex MNN11 subunit n=1 Tax=Geosmithia morbida TaxID=1094350 RepID=A0A9P5D3N5_9HYPO|nr:mannan polymerase II complex MNN11 subunit [Geosmithia morbida]KAF4121970.1 mannan polymerase II complex MNN11 subunit [Geosmithia morbida]
MHFAYPARKNSNPPPFRPRPSRSAQLLRRTRLRTIILGLAAILGILYLLSGTTKPDPYREHVPSGSPPVVIVTVVDPTTYSSSYLKNVEENRKLYAKKHGYETFIVKAHDYDTGGYQQSWAKVMAIRHAISTYPDCKYVWFLGQDAFVVEPGWSLDRLLLDQHVLEGLMIKDYPIVPPDSIIKTFSHLGGDDAHLVISQDKDGLVADSLIVRNGEWAKFFTETWLDPLYRSYNFQKAERHALEHMVQWHPTILSKVALVPQRKMAAYVYSNLGDAYQEGDFVAMLTGCSPQGENSCEKVSEWI